MVAIGRDINTSCIKRSCHSLKHFNFQTVFVNAHPFFSHNLIEVKNIGCNL